MGISVSWHSDVSLAPLTAAKGFSAALNSLKLDLSLFLPLAAVHIPPGTRCADVLFQLGQCQSLF